jgi:NADH-quinone oxidoreductase subunit H
VLIPAGTLDLVKIVEQQGGTWLGFIPRWNVLALFPAGLIAFIVYLISAIAETNRVPFDLPEAETELVAGFQTTDSALKFALFFMGEYVDMTTVSVLATTLFLGGWQGPLVGTLPLAWVWSGLFQKFSSSCSSTSGCVAHCRGSAMIS